MKFKLLLLFVLASLFAGMVRAESCTNVYPALKSDVKQADTSGVVTSETTTWHVQCIVTAYGLIYNEFDVSGTATGVKNCPPAITIAKFIGSGTSQNSVTVTSSSYSATSGTSACGAPAQTVAKTYCSGYSCPVCSTVCKPGYTRDPVTCQCKLQNSPIILDLNGGGFQLTGAESGVSFDISGTGTPIQMGWTASGAANAFLALPGADGIVHNGKQLFGNYTPQPASDSPNGFAALAVYDDPKNGGNGDGIIDSRDAVFASLRLWIDANHDGISQPEELHTLPSLGVNSISLKYKLSERTDQYGNVFRYRAPVNPDDATNVGKTAYDVFFVGLSPTANKCDVPVEIKKGGVLSVGR